jgi:Leucine-rich repeat (LRR) protein
MFLLKIQLLLAAISCAASAIIDYNQTTLMHWESKYELVQVFAIKQLDMSRYNRKKNIDLMKNGITETKVETTWITKSSNVFLISSPYMKSVRVDFSDVSVIDQNFLCKEPQSEDSSECQMKNLTRLHLGYNNINQISSDAFDEVTKLQQLYLNENKISFIFETTFKKLKDLRLIVLNDNLLQEIPPNLFSTNPTLEKIYLKNNQIKVVGQNAFAAPSLKCLSICKNLCTGKVDSSLSKETNIEDMIAYVYEECSEKKKHEII